MKKHIQLIKTIMKKRSKLINKYLIILVILICISCKKEIDENYSFNERQKVHSLKIEPLNLEKTFTYHSQNIISDERYSMNSCSTGLISYIYSHLGDDDSGIGENNVGKKYRAIIFEPKKYSYDYNCYACTVGISGNRFTSYDGMNYKSNILQNKKRKIRSLNKKYQLLNHCNTKNYLVSLFAPSSAISDLFSFIKITNLQSGKEWKIPLKIEFYTPIACDSENDRIVYINDEKRSIITLYNINSKHKQIIDKLGPYFPTSLKIKKDMVGIITHAMTPFNLNVYNINKNSKNRYKNVTEYDFFFSGGGFYYMNSKGQIYFVQNSKRQEVAKIKVPEGNNRLISTEKELCLLNLNEKKGVINIYKINKSK